MTTQSEVYETIQSIIPADLWAKYSHLSFAEMAKIDELVEWSGDLTKAENDWYAADDA